MVYFSQVVGFLLLSISVKLVLSFTNHTTPELNCRQTRWFYSEEIKTEIQLLHTIRDTLVVTKHAHNSITRFYNELKTFVPNSTSKSIYLQNLSNSFALARRISNMWPPKLSLMEMTFGGLIKNLNFGFFSTFVKDQKTYDKFFLSKPSTGEEKYFYNTIDTGLLWWSALTGLVRLQETYNLSAVDLASGRHPGMSAIFNHTALSARDCFDIGIFCLKVNIPDRAVEWLLEASRRAVNDAGLSIRKIKEYLHIAYCFIGDTVSHRKILRQLINDPVFSPEFRLCYSYSEMTYKSCKMLRLRSLQYSYNEIFLASLYVRWNLLDVGPLRGLCRKDTFKYPSDKRLRCRMIHYKQPYLRIGPLKMEELNIEPPVLVFHQVAYEREINDVMEENYNRTKPAQFDYGEGFNKYQDTQLNLFLRKEETKLDVVWNLKSATIANVGLYRSDMPMLASYGLGGEIRLHMDIGPTEEIFNEIYSRGDYITLMYWLNDPQEGGFTVFPKMDLAVVPEKGSAVLWFNRYPNLEVDSRTFHSGCPIITGTKWVLTKWFHVISQDFPKCTPGKELTRKYKMLHSWQ